MEAMTNEELLYRLFEIKQEAYDEWQNVKEFYGEFTCKAENAYERYEKLCEAWKILDEVM